MYSSLPNGHNARGTSASASPVDRPFTAQVRVGATEASVGSPTESPGDSAAAMAQAAREHGLRPPRLDLIDALYRPNGGASARRGGCEKGAVSQEGRAGAHTPLTSSSQSGECRRQPSLMSAEVPATTLRLRDLAQFDPERTAQLPSASADDYPEVSWLATVPLCGEDGGDRSSRVARAKATRVGAPDAGQHAASVDAEGLSSPSSSSSLTACCQALPWWKVILLRRDYRNRLTELATTFYRAEMNLLARTPEQLSSAQGQDKLAGVVMSQYVALPRRAVWSVRHPHSIIQHSTLQTMRALALHAMPPTMGAQQRMQQVAAVEHHLRTQRRASAAKTPAMKRCDRQDMLAGRVALPDPFDSEAEEILARNAALLNGPPPVVTVGERNLAAALSTARCTHEATEMARPLSSSVGAAGSDGSFAFGGVAEAPHVRERAQQLALYHFPSPPPSPRSRARASHQGRKCPDVKDTPYGTLVRSPSRLAAETTANARREAQRVRDEALSAASPGGGLQLSPEEYATRLAAEALARFDGTNNLYGLSYYWDAPFPPAGFIREDPEPRQAMWPDDVHDDMKRVEEIQKRREAEALVARVNNRARKLEYCRRYGLRADMAKLLKDEEEADAAGRRGVPDGALTDTAGGESGVGSLSEAQRQLRAQKPRYDGPLHINVVQLRERGEVVGRASNAAALVGQSENASSSASGSTPTRVLGTFRQSLLLIHFKIYCCALYEEQRQRRGGAGTRVTSVPIATRLAAAAAADDDDKHVDADSVNDPDEALLDGVPRIPMPVLRVQRRSPRLKKSGLRHTPDLNDVQDAVCWEGLLPVLPQEPTNPAVHVWRYLHQASFAARQSLRDVFNALDHDGEGRLVKQVFVEFVLDLLSLFFPTHLHDVHVAIAEEEWVYRGTTENVNFDVFFDKFFAFPLMFRRDVADVTEDDYVEFWSLVRICLFESAESTPTLISFEKTLMVPTSARDVATTFAATLSQSQTAGVRTAEPVLRALGTASTVGDDVLTEAAGSPVRIKKITGTCTASAAERMRAEKSRSMSRMLGANSNLSHLAASAQKQQSPRGTSAQDSHDVSLRSNAALDRPGTVESPGVSSAAPSDRITPETSAGSKAASVVALAQRERTVLRGAQAASAHYAAAVADGLDRKQGEILMSAVFGEAAHADADNDDDADGGNGNDGGLEGGRTSSRGPPAHGAQTAVAGRSRPPQRPRHRRLSLLAPIVGLTPAQVVQLYRRDYAHPEDYLLYQAMSEVMHQDPVVRQLPASRQYGVALSRGHRLVQARLATLGAVCAEAPPGKETTAAAAGTTSHHHRGEGARHSSSIGLEELGGGLLRGAEGVGMQAALHHALAAHKEQQRQKQEAAAAAARDQSHARGAHVAAGRVRSSDVGSGNAGVGQRVQRVAEAVQLRRAVMKQLEEDRQRAQLLQSSQRYQDSKRRRQARFNKALAKVESTASSWELHMDGVYDLTEPEPEVEDRLLHYLHEVSPEVYDGPVSLRERFLVHERFVEERRRRGRQQSGLSRVHSTVGGSAAASAPGAAVGGGGILGMGYGDTVVLRAPPEATTVAERLRRRGHAPTTEELYLASMDARGAPPQVSPANARASGGKVDGEGETARPTILEDGEAPDTRKQLGLESSSGLVGRRPSSHPLTSYAAGAYPVRPETVSSAYVEQLRHTEGESVDRQTLIDTLLREALLGPSDKVDSVSQGELNRGGRGLGAKKHSENRTRRGRRSGSGGSGGGRRIRGSPSSSFLLSAREVSAVAVLPSPASSDTDTSSSYSDVSDRKGTPARADSAHLTLKRTPSSKSLPSAARSGAGHVVPRRDSSRTARRSRVSEMEADEARTASVLLRKHAERGHSKPRHSVSSESVASGEWEESREESGENTLASRPRVLRLGGAPAACGEALRSLSASHSSVAEPPCAARADAQALPLPREDVRTDALAAVRLERHTRELLKSLSTSHRVPRQDSVGTHHEHHAFAPHRPPPGVEAAHIASLTGTPQRRAPRDAMEAAARVMHAGDSARHFRDRFETAGVRGGRESVDLARRLASQRAREQRWAQQHASASRGNTAKAFHHGSTAVVSARGAKDRV